MSAAYRALLLRPAAADSAITEITGTIHPRPAGAARAGGRDPRRTDSATIMYLDLDLEAVLRIYSLHVL